MEKTRTRQGAHPLIPVGIGTGIHLGQEGLHGFFNTLPRGRANFCKLVQAEKLPSVRPGWNRSYNNEALNPLYENRTPCKSFHIVVRNQMEERIRRSGCDQRELPDDSAASRIRAPPPDRQGVPRTARPTGSPTFSCFVVTAPGHGG